VSDSSCAFHGARVSSDTQHAWHVESCGRGVYLFRWNKGFYVSPFVVGDAGVTAFDPISATAAREYRRAIATVTDRPVTRLVYSHDHRDHIVGGAALGDNLEVCAHAMAARRIAQRGHSDIVAPSVALGDGALIAGAIEVHDFGPNHSDSNLLFVLPKDRGRMLLWVDGVEPGVAPYRNLPDTDFGGYLTSLERAMQLQFDCVLGGHTGPGEKRWVSDYRDYLLRLLEATDQAYRACGEQAPRPGEDGVAMTERVRSDVTSRAAKVLGDRYSHWAGFQQWAPMTADRILSFIITGN
jgi:glyoxylase-like metal-dependent hydrolase (beta-lactamase superfamily II)